MYELNEDFNTFNTQEEDLLIEINFDEYETLDPIPQQIYNAEANYIQFEKDYSILILDFFAGAGKTYTTAMLTAHLKTDQIPFVYFSANHEIASMFVKFRQFFSSSSPCTHIKGKAYVEKEFKKENCGGLCNTCTNMTLCKDHRECKDDIGFALLKKYKRNDFYCKRISCPEYEDCEHRLDIASLMTGTPRSWSGHFLHYHTLYREIYKKKWGAYYKPLLIFDEDMSNSFFVQERFSYLYLNEAIDNCFFADIQNIFLKMKEGYDEYNLISRRDKILRRIIEKKFKDEIFELMTNITLKMLKSEARKYDKKLMTYFQTNDELNYPNPINFLIEFKDFLDHFNGNNVDGFLSITKFFIAFDYYRFIEESDSIIILNATFESELFKKIIPANANLINNKIQGKFGKKQKVYALKGKDNIERYATYPLKSLYNGTFYTPKFDELISKAEYFSKRHKRTVIFCVNRLFKETKNRFYNGIQIMQKRNDWYNWIDDLKEGNQNELAKDLQDELDNLTGAISVETFSWGVGKNDYKDYDGCVILHTPYHNLNHFQKMLLLYDIDEEVLMKNETENKILQSFMRIRPISFDPNVDKKCEILIFSSLEFTDIDFKDGQEIKRFRLHNFYEIFDKNYKSINGDKIIKYLVSNKFSNSTQIRKYCRLNNNAVDKEIKLLLEKGYIGLFKKTSNGKGRPQKLYYVKTAQERQDYLDFKEFHG